jgi:hypothetical protein
MRLSAAVNDAGNKDVRIRSYAPHLLAAQSVFAPRLIH